MKKAAIAIGEINFIVIKCWVRFLLKPLLLNIGDIVKIKLALILECKMDGPVRSEIYLSILHQQDLFEKRSDYIECHST